LPWPDAKHPGDSRLLEPAAENAATAGRAQRRAVVPLYRAWILARPALRSRRPKTPGSPARVLDDVGQGAWHCTVRLVYGVLHGFIRPVWRGDGI